MLLRLSSYSSCVSIFIQVDDIRRILQSPVDAVQIASEAVQWVDNYGGVVLNQPGPSGQMQDEQQHDQPTDDEDNTYQEAPSTPAARVNYNIAST